MEIRGRDARVWSDGTEHDSYRGAPLGDDGYAYQRYVQGGFFGTEHVEWTAVQERNAAVGTQGQWSAPATSGPSKPMTLAEMRASEPSWSSTFWDAFWHRERYGAMGQVSNTDPYHIAAGARFTGIAALSVATLGLREMAEIMAATAQGQERMNDVLAAGAEPGGLVAGVLKARGPALRRAIYDARGALIMYHARLAEAENLVWVHSPEGTA